MKQKWRKYRVGIDWLAKQHGRLPINSKDKNINFVYSHFVHRGCINANDVPQTRELLAKRCLAVFCRGINGAIWHFVKICPLWSANGILGSLREVEANSQGRSLYESLCWFPSSFWIPSLVYARLRLNSCSFLVFTKPSVN